MRWNYGYFQGQGSQRKRVKRRVPLKPVVGRKGNGDALGGRVQKVDGWKWGRSCATGSGKSGCSEAKDQHRRKEEISTLVTCG